ncbi:glycosyltransferase family 4 protein [Flavobacterium algicola]|uniref:glycosyltransferase family 4 protein n=1 Tax=Flavobacterium algicola TaxID=556529 RepID=UPI001EFC8992|nr:glycosyltransferase family 1 protein [Flavobacterium algicola]MCG9793930.1 glycosyltransferase family 4 protein [Flavobacterium algicola]
MKILYDHQIFTQQQYGGISRYFYELIKRYDKIEDSCNVATLLSNNAYYNQGTNPKLKSFFPKNHFKGKDRIIKTINQKVSKSSVKAGNFDVLHPTYYDTYFLNEVKNKPFVITFYDMIHEKFANQFEELRLDTKMFDNKRRLLDNASRVIAISETTKNDLIDLFDVDSNKIDIVYLGNSLENISSASGSSRLVDEDYILFVGNRGIYKNFNFFIKSIAPLLIDNNLKVICAGGGSFTIEELLLFKELRLENYVVFKPIFSDEVLSNYYSHAIFFCFPSLYEGFGIPVLESFACGCPALLSSGGSLPEVGGDAAIYFNPTNQESLFKLAQNLIVDENLRNVLKNKGYNRLKSFSWDKSFAEHLDVYKKVF